MLIKTGNDDNEHHFLPLLLFQIGTLFFIMYWIFIGLFVLNELNVIFDFSRT
jgi:hypothetical protein